MKFISVILCMLTGISLAYAQDKSIIFNQNSWKDIKQQAQRENKLIFLDAYTEWCGPCKVMDKEVFTNNEVADFYNQNFVNVKIDMEKGIGATLAKKYEIRAYPTLLFLDSEGDIIHVSIGGRKVEGFIELGKEALKPERKLAAFQSKFKKGNRDYDFMTTYLNLMQDLGVSTDSLLTVYFNTQPSDSLYSKNNWVIITQHLWHTNNNAFWALTENENKFTKLYNEQVVKQTVFNLCRREMSNIAFSDSIDSKKYLSLRNKIIKYCLPLFTESFLYMTDKIYYANKKDWINYVEITTKFANKYDITQDKALHEIAWNFYLNINQSDALNKAKIWAETAISLKPSSTYYDTYAHILFKLGRKEEAITQEEKAIKFAKENNEDTSLLEEELAKMKK